MDKDQKKPETVDDYIASYPPEVQEKLQKLRATIKAAAPKAQEKISYQMPAYMLEGALVYFGVHKTHIGFYPTSSGIEKFKAEFSGYQSSKGAVQFPLDQSIPFDLVTRIVTFRVQENLAKAEAKRKK